MGLGVQTPIQSGTHLKPNREKGLIGEPCNLKMILVVGLPDGVSPGRYMSLCWRERRAGSKQGNGEDKTSGF